jgi:hypothetical protein
MEFQCRHRVGLEENEIQARVHVSLMLNISTRSVLNDWVLTSSAVMVNY